jgi:hypothetical protein
MTIQQNFQQRPKTLKEFTAIGVLVTDVPTTMCNNLRVVVENAGGGNTILVKGKLFQQAAWQTLATINGSTAGVTVDISVVDEYQIECSAYAASGGTPKVVASAFFNQASGGGGGGTITGASNVGTAGEGLFDGEVAGVLNFRNINAGSSKVTVTLDGANKEVDLDVDESQIDVRNLDNVSPGTNYSFAGWNGSGELASVPGWTYDDVDPSQIGIQNGVTIPGTTTDYISISISPTVANAGLTSLAGVQLNSPINQTAGSYDGFQVFGYGTSKPTTFTGFLSQPGYTGVGTTQTHFLASGSADVTGVLQGFSMSCSGDAGSVGGLSIAPTGSYTNATGISIDLSSATITNRPVGLDIQNGTVTSTVTFQTTSSLPTLVDSGNVIRPIFEVASGSPITGTDVLMSNLAGFMDIKDNHSGSAIDLGIASVGFVSQVAVAATKTADNISMLLAGLAIEGTSAGGTVTDAHLIRAFAANFGGTLNIGTLYGLKVESGLSALATLAFGISVDDQGTENYVPRMVVSGATKTVSSSDVALDINDAKAFRLGRVTTAQRLAMTPIQGLLVFDTDTNKPYHADGTSWNQI